MPTSIQPQEPRVATLGPDSLAWKHAGDRLQLLLAGTTLVLQVAHPVVGAGVGDHSVFKKDPWGRLQRTTEWGLRLLYGGPEEAVRAGRDLRAMHRTIRGTDHRGRRYDALDPEAYTWVHMTSFASMVMAQRHFGERPFTAAEERRLYGEWLQQGRVLGIRDADMPADLPAFRLYFDEMVVHRLEPTEIAHHLLEVSMRRAPIKPPPLRGLPTPVWERAYGSAGGLAKLVTVATLPPALRARLGLSFDTEAERRFRRFKRAVRLCLPAVPARLRYMPPAYSALAASS
jgi:uncharacterized protein (DUF2236 family)